MHSSIRCLQSIIPNLKADEKLFLILVLSTSESTINPGEFALIRETGVQLGKRFRFTKEASFRALHKLRDQKLIDEITEQGRIGRPRKVRKLIARSWEGKERNRDVFRAGLINQSYRLISNRLKHPKLAEQTGINNTLFMLLLVLLSKADRSGVVTTSSQAELSEYTGIPRSQVQRRTYQLQELGLIAEIIPGLVEGAILGKPNSIYYLNLDHPILKNTGIRTDPVPIRGKGVSSTEIDQVVMKLGHPERNDRLSSAAELAASPLGMKRTQISSGSWEQNAPDFLKRPAAKLYAQCVIERYAAKLISAPTSINSASEWRNAQDRASGDFVHELKGGRTNAMSRNVEDSRMFYSLCADLEELSHQLASQCLKIGKLPNRPSPLGTTPPVYRILPSRTSKRFEIKLERITFSD